MKPEELLQDIKNRIRILDIKIRESQKETEKQIGIKQELEDVVCSLEFKIEKKKLLSPQTPEERKE